MNSAGLVYVTQDQSAKDSSKRVGIFWHHHDPNGRLHLVGRFGVHDEFKGNPFISPNAPCSTYLEISPCFKVLNWCRFNTCSAVSVSSMLDPRRGFPSG